MKTVSENTTPKSFLDNFPAWQSIAIGFAIWTILGLSFASESYLRNYRAGRILHVKYFIIEFLTEFYIYALFSILLFKLSERFPLQLKIAPKTIVIYFCHLIASVIFSIVSTSLNSFIAWTWEDICEHCLSFDMIFDPHFLHRGIIVYWGIIIVGQGIEYYREMQSEKVRVAELSALLSDAQLSALKMQIHPHFLFNTLNSIATLIHHDAESADLMLTRLSDFLRMTLQNSGEPIVSLERELHFLKTYLDIEKVRFQERLTVEFSADEETLNSKVPNLILQPIVENSIRHGIANMKENGFLFIRAKRNNARLIIEIEDNGAGLNSTSASAKTQGGVGLSNTKARLRQIYGDDFSFEIGTNRESGTLVRFDLPFIV